VPIPPGTYQGPKIEEEVPFDFAGFVEANKPVKDKKDKLKNKKLAKKMAKAKAQNSGSQIPEDLVAKIKDKPNPDLMMGDSFDLEVVRYNEEQANNKELIREREIARLKESDPYALDRTINCRREPKPKMPKVKEVDDKLTGHMVTKHLRAMQTCKRCNKQTALFVNLRFRDCTFSVLAELGNKTREGEPPMLFKKKGACPPDTGDIVTISFD
jgi:hypothetical protein